MKRAGIKRDEGSLWIGPSGYFNGSTDEARHNFAESSLDVEQRDDIVPDHVEDVYKYFWDMPYQTTGNEIGVRNVCQGTFAKN